MDMFSVKIIKELLNQQRVIPRKGLGQNFLTSRRVFGDILRAANLKKSDTVLEIGPGIGTLTQGLAQSAKRVIAVEKDFVMVDILKETTKNLPNIEIVHGDILGIVLTKGKHMPRIVPTSYKVVANLPYYITSPVIRKFLELKENSSPSLMVLMVQKEVAQRICAKPPKMSLLAVSVQFYAEPEIISYVKKTCFWPQPKVDSAILQITPLINADRKLINTDIFFKIVKAGFKQPRKQLGNNLCKGLSFARPVVDEWLGSNGIRPAQRAETLSVQDWIKLAKDKM